MTDYGSTDHLSEEDFTLSEELLRSARWLDITCLKEEAVDPLLALMERLKEGDGSVNIFLAPSNSMIEPKKDAVREMLRYADVLVLNDFEAHNLIDEEDPETAAFKLQRCGPRRVFVTLGPGGILHYDGNCVNRVSAFPVPPERILNTTGAGDVAASKLLEGLIKGQDTETLLLRATAAGDMKIQSEKVGAKEGLPTNGEIDEFLSANRDRVTLKSHTPELKDV